MPSKNSKKSTTSEVSPLLTAPSAVSTVDKAYYFAPTATSASENSTNPLPPGTSPDQFQSRPMVGGARGPKMGKKRSSFANSKSPPSTFLSALFGKKPAASPTDGLLVRKVPVKVEPKVFFANERTFLAWLHTSVTLASIAIAIIAFSASTPTSSTSITGQVYGLTLLPVSIAFIIYALRQYTSRAGMIRRREPGPYEDTVGPVVLGGALCVSIVANFGLKLWEITH